MLPPTSTSSSSSSSNFLSLRCTVLSGFLLTFCIVSPLLLLYVHSTTDMIIDEPREQLRIYFLTYNVNGQAPLDISKLVGQQQLGSCQMYVVALQELPLASLIFTNVWKKEFMDYFAKRNYVLLETETLTVTMIMIFVPRKEIAHFYGVQTDRFAVDMLYRKGAVGIRFFWNSMTFCVVGSHLTPHDENYKTRNENYHQILAKMRLGSNHILAHAHVFWLGDLNYRIDHLSGSEIQDLALPPNHRYGEILKHDQLHLAMSQGKRGAFGPFSEAHIDFAPTYKFVIGTQDYNSQRKPAYTDRILWCDTLARKMSSNSTSKPRYEHYDSLPEFTLSDHKPVRMIASIPAKTIDAKMSNVQMRATLNRFIHKFSYVDSADQPAPMVEGIGTESSLLGFHPQPNDQAADSDLEEAESVNVFDEDLVTEDRNTKESRKLWIVFDDVGQWYSNRPQIVRFRITNRRNSQPVAPFPNLLQNVFSPWDWIGLFREDWISRQDYVSFANPDFDFIEEAQDALGLDDESQSTENLGEEHTGEASGDESLQASVSEPLSSTTTSSSDARDSSGAEQFIYTARFDENHTFIPTGRYQLIYFRRNGDIMGMSEPFAVDFDHTIPFEANQE